MYPDQEPNTLIIGAREALIGVVIFIVLVIVIVVLIFMLGRDREAVETIETATPADSAVEEEITETPVYPTPGIPADRPVEVVTHVVRAGQTLTSIAVMYSVELDDIRNLNNFSSDFIQPGQRLEIPLTTLHQTIEHEVRPGETLLSIADAYGITLTFLQATNNISDPNAVFIGQKLLIIKVPDLTRLKPEDGTYPGGPLLVDWTRSLLEGDLAANYPEVFEHPRYILHYQPDTFADRNLGDLITLIDAGLAEVEDSLQVHLNEKFDLYVAGTLFAAPNTHLRGFTRANELQVFILFDGSGTPQDNAYFITHELTQLVAWQEWDLPSSTLLLKGLSTYVGGGALEKNAFISTDQLCLQFDAAGQIPAMASIERDWQAFDDHLGGRYTYFSSGCFVEYLLAVCSMDNFAELFTTSDYRTLCGGSLETLDTRWREALAVESAGMEVNTEALVNYTEELALTYDYIYSNYRSSPEMQQAYAAADRARVAIWQGDYAAAREWLLTVYTLTGFDPYPDG